MVMVFAQIPTKVQQGGDEELQTYKVALSLHEMLSSTGPSQSLVPTRARQSPAEALSPASSDDSVIDERATSARRGFQPHHTQNVPKPENLEAHANECIANGMPITTMMLRNIPNKYTQSSLLKEINDLGFAGTYDFFYLPMDVHNRSNVGYAFINFLMPTDAEWFRSTFADHRFRRYESRKIGSVCVAHIQGLDANLRHFENRAVTQARNDQYRPIVLKGQQRIDFDHAVASAKAKEARFQTLAPEPCGSRASIDAGDARQGLEAAIRELLAATRSAAPAAAASGAPLCCRTQPATGTRPKTSVNGGLNPADADVAQLLSLRSLLVDRLCTSKDSPAYINMTSLGSYASSDVATATCDTMISNLWSLGTQTTAPRLR